MQLLSDRIREAEREFRRQSPPRVLHESPTHKTGLVTAIGGGPNAFIDPDAHLLENFIRLNSLDMPIYRTFSLHRFIEILQSDTMGLVMPTLWEDPFEDLVSKCMVTPGQVGDQISLASLRKPVYGQCWSLIAESDALWRIYSTVKKDSAGRNEAVDREGVRVRATPRRLLRALWMATEAPAESCFLGAVRYMPQREAIQCVADEIGRKPEAAFAGGRGHAESLLIKREAFSHEREVRLLQVVNRASTNMDRVFNIPINPSNLFSQVTLDPRLGAADRLQREKDLRALGYTGSITTSELYQSTLFEIIV